MKTLALKRLSKYVAAVSAERYLFQDTSSKPDATRRTAPSSSGIPDYCDANTHYVQTDVSSRIPTSSTPPTSR
jgi:hypothetical protein